jgi:hypothetical protein
MRQVMHIPPIACLAEVVVIADCTSEACSFEVLFFASITGALMFGGATCCWSWCGRWWSRAYSCHEKGVNECAQEGLALAVGITWTTITCTPAILSCTVYAMQRTQDGANGVGVKRIKPMGTEEHNLGRSPRTSSEEEILLDGDHVTCNRDFAECV